MFKVIVSIPDHCSSFCFMFIDSRYLVCTTLTVVGDSKGHLGVCSVRGRAVIDNLTKKGRAHKFPMEFACYYNYYYYSHYM